MCVERNYAWNICLNLDWIIKLVVKYMEKIYRHSFPQWKNPMKNSNILATMKIYKNVKQFNFKNSSLIFHISLVFVLSWLTTNVIKRSKHSLEWILSIVVKEFLPLFIFFDHMRRKVENASEYPSIWILCKHSHSKILSVLMWKDRNLSGMKQLMRDAVWF